MAQYVMETPIRDEDIERLQAGDIVSITGYIYTARDAAHKKIISLLEAGERLPFDLEGQIIYYAGPAPAKPGQVIGPIGPTTSGRMDAYTLPLLANGLKGMIGKGKRSQEVKAGLVKYRGLYFAAIGGAAALLAKKVKSAELIAYPELGPEAVYKLEVVDFPVYVINDIHGNDLYEEGQRKFCTGCEVDTDECEK